MQLLRAFGDWRFASRCTSFTLSDIGIRRRGYYLHLGLCSSISFELSVQVCKSQLAILRIIHLPAVDKIYSGGGAVLAEFDGAPRR